MKCNNKWLLLTFLLIISALFLVSTVDVGAVYTGIDGGYVGTAVCATCHTTQNADFQKSGHSYKYRHTGGATPTAGTDPISTLLIGSTPLLSTLNANGGVATDDGTGHLAWSAADYVVGGWGWKARWGIKDNVNVDGGGNPTASNLTGFVWSSASSGASGAQYNMLAFGAYDPLSKRENWSKYGNAGGQTKAYNCAVCHNTNGTNAKSGEECYTPFGGPSVRTQPWGNNPTMSTTTPGGFKSEWTFDSVQCEACHGAGLTHSNAPSSANIASNTSLVSCGGCHTRHENDEECFATEAGAIKATGGVLTNGAADGFLKHHEQANEMVGWADSGAGKGVHADLTCVACHDPHKRSHKVPDEVATALGITDNHLSAKARGAVTDCASCHEAQKNATGTVSSTAAITAHNAAGVDCIDCHMAEATKSATGIKGTWGKKGDDKTHIFKISPLATDATVGTRTNSRGKPIAENYLSTDYACGKCHDPGAFEGFGAFAAGAALAGPTSKATSETSATNYHNVVGIDGGYVGSSTCSGCHTQNYGDWSKSGHPYKYRTTSGLLPVNAAPAAGEIFDPLSSLLPTPATSAISTATHNGLMVDTTPADGKLDWSAINYVIGGFGWKARFGIIDPALAGTGYVWTGSAVQFNMLAADPALDTLSKRADWSAYNAATDKKYECAKCHNTNGSVLPATYSGGCGVDPGGRTQPWANNPGMSASFTAPSTFGSAAGGYRSEWTFDGVHCEACHGPSKDHVVNPTNAAKYPPKNLSQSDCGQCHTRAADDKECFGTGAIGAMTGGAADGFLKHHEQYNELVGYAASGAGKGVHSDMTCQECHNPHKRTHKVTDAIATALGITDNDQSAVQRGAVVDCTTCHTAEAASTGTYYSSGAINSHKAVGVTCIDCHMAEAMKSGTGIKGTWGKKGDVKSHIAKINPSSTAATLDPADARKNAALKPIAENYLSLDFVCGKCHDDGVFEGGYGKAAGTAFAGPHDKASASVVATNYHNVFTDLVVSYLSVPAMASPGAVISVTDSTKNRGLVAAGASTTAFYLSTDTALDGGDTLLSLTRAVGALAGNATSTGTTSVTIPGGTAPGTYYIIAKADNADAVVGELSETNNTRASSALSVVANNVDLVISSFYAPSSAKKGTNISITDATKNRLTGTAGASTTAFYLSANTTLDGGDTLLGSRAVPALGSGAVNSGTTSVTIPAGTTAGAYYIIWKADNAGVVGETDETNNTKYKAITITN